jgi:hypothetical protein
MAFSPTVLAAFLCAILVFSVLGLALQRALGQGWASGWAFAPALGWAVFEAIGFPLQDGPGRFTRVSTGLIVALALAASLAVLRRRKRREDAAPGPPPWVCGLAALIALIPLVALLPKAADGGIIIGTTAFDHSKIAMVDAMVRQGLPAANPFFGMHGAPSALSYYYLWHFGAAQLSILGGISGWEADAAMTGFTAYASMLLMMGLAARLCAGRGGAAAVWVAILSLVGSLRPLLSMILGAPGLDRLLSHYTGLSGWMVQASWVPQHMASACCGVLSVLLLADLAQRPRLPATLMLGAVAAAGFGASAWVGGVTFALCAPVIGVVLLLRADKGERLRFAFAIGAAAVVTVLLALPLLHSEFGTLAARQGGSPIAFHPYEVVGAWADPAWGRWLDLPAYWLLLLPIDLPAIYPVGIALLALGLGESAKADAPHGLVLTLLAVCGLGVAWLLISTIGNNDLGWRAILPAVLVLTPVVAAALARWIPGRAYAPAAAALGLAAAGGIERQVFQNLHGRDSDNAPDFAASPALWAAVRRHAGPADRVADNPTFLDDLTDWPVNPSWAMLSDRPSCFSGWETARAYVDLPHARLRALDDQFTRVFEGMGSPDDVRQMARAYGCRVAVVTPSDGAWTRDPFASSPYYRLVEMRKDQWRIYVAGHIDKK